MKKKMSLDTEKIKQFFFLHTEKIVLGVFVLVMLMLMYGFVQHEVFTRTPQELSQAAQNAQSHITASTWSAEQMTGDLAKIDFDPLVPRVEQQRTPLDAQTVATPIAWRPRIGAIGTRRTKPDVLPLEQIRVSSGYGAMAFSDAGGAAAGAQPAAGGARNSQVTGTSWIVITGLVPLAKQREAYREALPPNADGTVDEPMYWWLDVERAAIPPGASTDTPLDWKSISTVQPQELVNSWIRGSGRGGAEVVPAQYVTEKITFPLGPLLGRAWDPQSVGHPAINPVEETVEDTPADEVPEEQPPVAAPPGGGPPIPPGLAPGNQRPGSQPNRPARNITGGNRPAQQQAELEYQLARFFDFTAEDGTDYRYRVRAYLLNPNHSSRVKNMDLLEDPQLAKDHYIISDWSAPSAVVRAPNMGRVLAGPAKSPAGRTEPSMQMTAVVFDPANGAHASKQFPIFRGQAVNILNEKATAQVPQPNGNTAPQEITMNFVTNHVLVDLFPAEDGNAKALVLGPNLQLQVRSEQQDRAEREQLAAQATAPAATTPGPAGRTPGTTPGPLRGRPTDPPGTDPFSALGPAGN